MAESFVDRFLNATKSSPNPEPFRKWMAIGLIAASLGRRVYTITLEQAGPLFPNLYIILVSRPGIGKTLSNKNARRLLKKVPGLWLGPDKTTPEALIKLLAGRHIDHPTCDMVMWTNELSVLLSRRNDALDIRPLLTELYDCNEDFEYLTNAHGSLKFKNVCMNFVATTTNDWIATSLRIEDLGDGFATRILWIGWPNEPEVPRYFTKYQMAPEVEAKIIQELTDISKLEGGVSWEEAAKAAYQDMADRRFPPVPQDPNLEHYRSRRAAYAAKLSLIASIARGGFKITVADVLTGVRYMHEAEKHMAFALSGLGGNITKLVEHRVLMALDAAGGLMPEARVLEIMSTSLPVNQVKEAFELMLKKGIMARTGLGGKLVKKVEKGQVMDMEGKVL